MPVSRIISDLDQLVSVFSMDGTPSSSAYDELRLVVARIDELRRQLDVAQVKLAPVLSLAEMKYHEDQIQQAESIHILNNRFEISEEMRTEIPQIDENHRALFQSGNSLYQLAIQYDVKVSDIEIELNLFVQCANKIFDIEEQLMESSSYPNLYQHQVTHQRMRDYLSETHKQILIQPLSVIVRLEKFLGSWFLFHQQRDDIDFGRYYHRGSKILPKVAELKPQDSNPVWLTDPVCVTPVTDTSSHRAAYRGIMFNFCSEACCYRFITDPTRFVNVTLLNRDEPETNEVLEESGQFEINEIPVNVQNQSILNPEQNAGESIRSSISSKIIEWRERREVKKTCSSILALYRSVSKQNPELARRELYLLTVKSHTGCDNILADKILNDAEESFAEWPIRRVIKLRDVIHFMIIKEYLHFSGEVWMRSEIKNIIESKIPVNL